MSDDYVTIRDTLQSLDKKTLCYLISDMMFFEKIDITDINTIYTERLKEKIAEKDRIIYEADNCIFESVFTDSLGKPADDKALQRKLEWLDKVGTHNMEGVFKYLKNKV